MRPEVIAQTVWKQLFWVTDARAIASTARVFQRPQKRCWWSRWQPVYCWQWPQMKATVVWWRWAPDVMLRRCLLTLPLGSTMLLSCKTLMLMRSSRCPHDVATVAAVQPCWGCGCCCATQDAVVEDAVCWPPAPRRWWWWWWWWSGLRVLGPVPHCGCSCSAVGIVLVHLHVSVGFVIVLLELDDKQLMSPKVGWRWPLVVCCPTMMTMKLMDLLLLRPELQGNPLSPRWKPDPPKQGVKKHILDKFGRLNGNVLKPRLFFSDCCMFPGTGLKPGSFFLDTCLFLGGNTQNGKNDVFFCCAKNKTWRWNKFRYRAKSKTVFSSKHWRPPNVLHQNGFIFATFWRAKQVKGCLTEPKHFWADSLVSLLRPNLGASTATFSAIILDKPGHIVSQKDSKSMVGKIVTKKVHMAICNSKVFPSINQRELGTCEEKLVGRGLERHGIKWKEWRVVLPFALTPSLFPHSVLFFPVWHSLVVGPTGCFVWRKHKFSKKWAKLVKLILKTRNWSMIQIHLLFRTSWRHFPDLDEESLPASLLRMKSKSVESCVGRATRKHKETSTE